MFFDELLINFDKKELSKQFQNVLFSTGFLVSISLLFSDLCQYHMNFLPKITLLQQGPFLDNVLNLKKCWQNQDKKGRRLPNSIYF